MSEQPDPGLQEVSTTTKQESLAQAEHRPDAAGRINKDLFKGLYGKLLAKLTQNQNAKAFAFAAAGFYVGFFLNVYNLVAAALKGRWSYAGPILGALVLPGIMHALMADHLFRVIGMPDNVRRKEVGLILCQLHRATDARVVLRKKSWEQIRFFIHQMDLVGNLSLSIMPSIAANMVELLSNGLVADTGPIFGAILLALISGPKLGMHSAVCGNVGFADLRDVSFWNITGKHPLKHALSIYTLEFCAVSYRLVMYGMILACLGSRGFSFFVGGYHLVVMLLLWDRAKIYDKGVFLKAVPTVLFGGILFWVSDFCWMQPCGGVSGVGRMCYPMRLVQMAAATYLLVHNWTSMDHYDATVKWVLLIYGAMHGAIYIFGHPIYCWYICDDRYVKCRQLNERKVEYFRKFFCEGWEPDGPPPGGDPNLVSEASNQKNYTEEGEGVVTKTVVEV